MTVVVSADGVILLQGACHAEDAETLLRHLAEEPDAGIDWSACELAHTAVVQVLLAARREIVGSPPSAFLRDHVALVLIGNRSGA